MTHTPDMTAGFGAATKSNSAKIQREFDSDMAYPNERIAHRERYSPSMRSDNIADIATEATLMLKKYSPMSDENGEPVGFVPVHENGKRFDPDTFTEYVLDPLKETLDNCNVSDHERATKYLDMITAMRDHLTGRKEIGLWTPNGLPYVNPGWQTLDQANSPEYQRSRELALEIMAGGEMETNGFLVPVKERTA